MNCRGKLLQVSLWQGLGYTHMHACVCVCVYALHTPACVSEPACVHPGDLREAMLQAGSFTRGHRLVATKLPPPDFASGL